MKGLLRVLLVVIIISIVPLGVQAKEIKYNHSSITVSEVKERADFTVLSPVKIPDDWTLEIKTYPWGEKHITNFRLHYMDSNDTKLMVGIEQSSKRSLYNGVKKGPNIHLVDISGIKGYFSEWGNSGELDDQGEITGGLLCWKQDETYIVMDSSRITKEMMLDIARSMKVVK